jgi:hypothetical protein
LLSYLLYECDDAKVPLEKELRMMKEYMFMERNKIWKNHGNGNRYERETSAIKQSHHFFLLPFIENSFSQCNSHAEQSWINLELRMRNNLFTMKLMNGLI